MLKHNYKNYIQCRRLGSTDIFLHDKVLILGYFYLMFKKCCHMIIWDTTHIKGINAIAVFIIYCFIYKF